MFGRVAAWWRKNAKMDTKRLSQLGLMIVLSYGFVSNVNAMLLTCVSVYVAMKTTGMSPLASKAALKKFGLTYAGLYVISNFLRPLRISLALALSPAFDRVVRLIQGRLRCKKRTAVVCTVFLANVVGSFFLLFMGLGLASLLTGVPINVRQLSTLARAGKAARTVAA